MAPWKRICCAVDFSPPSQSAADEAAALAVRLGAALTLLHVLEAPAASGRARTRARRADDVIAAFGGEPGRGKVA